MSGSQKALKVLSIIMIVFSILIILTGAVMLAGSGLSEVTSESVSVEGSTVNLGVAALVFGVMLVIVGIIDLIIGFLGVRGAKNPSKIGPFWVLCIIGIVLDIFNIVSTIAQGGDVLSFVVNLIFIIVLFVLANNIKKENA